MRTPDELNYRLVKQRCHVPEATTLRRIYVVMVDEAHVPAAKKAEPGVSRDSWALST